MNELGGTGCRRHQTESTTRRDGQQPLDNELAGTIVDILHKAQRAAADCDRLFVDLASPRHTDSDGRYEFG